MNPIEIRGALLTETNLVAQVLRDSFAEFEHLYTPQAYAATTPSADQIVSRWSEGPVWIAIRDREAIGTVAAVPKESALFLRSMAIQPSARGLGIGTALLDHVERYAIENRFHRMRLSTTPFLQNAIRLYERFGFTRIAEGPQDLFGTPLFTMSKELP